MEFPTEIKTTQGDIPIEAYFKGPCEKCGGPQLKKRSSYWRTLADLGTPRERRVIRLQVTYFECSCGHYFSPKHPDYPPKLEYTPAVITYALESYFRFNCSAPSICKDLNQKLNVEVPLDTITTWIKAHGEKFLASLQKEKPITHPEEVKTVSLDGTFTSVGRELIGKKSSVVLLSLTSLKNGTFSLTLSEMKP